MTAPGYDPVITHIFTPNGEYLSEDAVFGVKERPIGDLTQIDERDRAAAYQVPIPFWSVAWDFKLAAKAPISDDGPTVGAYLRTG